MSLVDTVCFAFLARTLKSKLGPMARLPSTPMDASPALGSNMLQHAALGSTISCFAPLLPKRSGRAPLRLMLQVVRAPAPPPSAAHRGKRCTHPALLMPTPMPTPIWGPFAVPTLAGPLLPLPACPQFRHHPSHQSRPALPPTLHAPHRRPACSSAGWSGCGAGRWCSARRMSSASQLPTGWAGSSSQSHTCSTTKSAILLEFPPEMEQSER